MSTERELRVTIEYGDFKTQFEGNAEEAFDFFVKSVSEIYPIYKVLSEIVFTPDIKKLLEGIKDLAVITPEGPYINPNYKLTTEQAILLCLVAAFVGFKLRILNKDTLVVNDVCGAAAGQKEKSVRNRLGEMARVRFVKKTEEGKYNITTLGVKYFLDNVLPSLKAQKVER